MATKTAALGRTSATTLAILKRLSLGAGVVAAVIGVESVKAAANYQTALARIHTQAGATTATVGKLSRGILGMTTAVATAPTTLAQAAFHIASVGQKSLTSAQQLAVLKTAAKGAKLGGADLIDVTNALTTSIVSGIKGVHDYTQSMGVLNATVGAGDMHMQDLAEALSTGVLASARNAGLSITDVSGALAILGDNMRRGSIAGNTLGRTFNLMLAPSTAAAKALKTIGLTQSQLADDMRSRGLVAALGDLKQHLVDSGLSATQQAQVISEAFGRSRGSTYVELLVQQLSRLRGKIHDISGSGHTFASSWAAYTKTFQYAFDQMQDAVKKLGIQIGQKLLPAATTFVRYITAHGIPALQQFGTALKTGLLPTLVSIKNILGGALLSAMKSVNKGFNQASTSWASFGKDFHKIYQAFVEPWVAALGRTIRGLGFIIEGAGYAVRALESAFRHLDSFMSGPFVRSIGGAVALLLKGLKILADTALTFIGTFIHAAASAFGWLPFGIGGSLKSAASKFDGFRSSVDSTLSSIASDALSFGQQTGANWISGFNAKSVYAASARHYVKPGEFAGLGNVTPGEFAGIAGSAAGGGGTVFGGGGAGTGTTGAGSAGKSAAAVLHVTAKNLTKALAKGLLDGWQGYALTVRESLSTGTQHLLEQLGKQFEAIQKRMTTLVANAKTKLHDALTNERSYVQQMMSDAGLGNVPTVDSGYTGQTTRLTDIGAFLGSQAKNYALFDRLLRRLGHSGLSKGLVSQIAQMGPTQGIQYAQQILANPGQIAQINAYQKQISASAKAIGQDQYGSQVAADRKNLRRQTQLQERMAHRLDHLARDIGREVAANVHPGKGGISGKPSGLSVHEAKQLQRDLNKLDRLVGKKK